MIGPAQLRVPGGRRQNVGALVVGGDHPGLAIARSLGRRGIPVYVLDDQHCISSYSKYVTRVLRVSDLRGPEKTVHSILEAGQSHDLRDWVLFPTRDETVLAISQHRDRLAEFFRVTTSPWEAICQVWDKNNTYKFAAKLQIPVPETWNIKSIDELPSLYPRLPLAIKPAIKENFFYSTGAKAWRAETPEQLRALYRDAARFISPAEIMIQEIIPGDGERQFSYCTFFRDGHAHSSMIAKRLRQYPREFGRAASYVETTEAEGVEELAQRFLRAIDFYGIAEVEFKQDSRDGKYKLLDVNARAWGFHGLGQAAGIDFPYLLFSDQLGLPLPRCTSKTGIGWMRLLSDVPTAISGLLGGHLTLRSYLRSVGRSKAEAVFTWSDPLPSIAEFALLPYLLWVKMFRGKIVTSPDHQSRGNGKFGSPVIPAS